MRASFSTSATRSTLLLSGVLALSGALASTSCGSSGDVGNADDDGGVTPVAPCLNCDTDGGPPPAPGNATVAGLRIEPADAVLVLSPGQRVTQTFRAFAQVNGVERDVTAHVVFYVPDNFLVGGFPADGSPTFTSRLPATATDPPQRGGRVTVQAQATNGDGTPVLATTSLTVQVTPLSLSQPGATPPLPASPGTLFTTLSPTPARQPTIGYPNDGAMLPPNLRMLDVHWRPGDTNELFELSFIGTNSTVTYYARCGGGAGYRGATCGLTLDASAYAWIAESNNGGSVKIRVRGTTNAGGTYGESQEITVHFAQNGVEGGLYYWSTIINAIGKVMRVDFGNPNSLPENFIVPPEAGLDGSVTCVGCHALSRDGSKMVASVGGRWDGRLVFLNDLSKPKTDPTWATQNGAPNGTPALNRVQFASFDPTGSQFVAVYGDPTGGQHHPDGFFIPDGELLPLGGSAVPADMNANKLFFHDGATGVRTGSLALDFKPVHPDWSPNGEMIAVTHVGNAQTTTQHPTRGGIDVIRRQGTTWLPPTVAVPPETDKNRINPSFSPDSAFFYFSESTCPAGQPDHVDCDGDTDPSSRIFAAKPVASATRVPLTKAGTRGVADVEDAMAATGDTFPRSTPFTTAHNGGTLMWATIASQRAPGYRVKAGAQLLWMFAVDPAKVLAGDDGSFAAFFLPLQDFATSNHIGQWTEKVVGGNAPPPPPPPPPPPAPAVIR